MRRSAAGARHARNAPRGREGHGDRGREVDRQPQRDARRGRGRGAPPRSAPAAPPAAPRGGAAAAPAAAPRAAAPRRMPPARAPLPAAARAALEPRKADGRSRLLGRARSGPPRATRSSPSSSTSPSDKPAFAAATPLKFGGVVTDESGKEVDSFWEDANFTEVAEGTRKDRVFDRSVALPPGSYKGTFGLFAAEGQPPVASASANFKLDAEVDRLRRLAADPLQRPGAADQAARPRRSVRLRHREADQGRAQGRPRSRRPTASGTSTRRESRRGRPGRRAAARPAAGAPAAPAADAPKPRIMTRINVQRDGQDAFAPFTGPADSSRPSPGALEHRAARFRWRPSSRGTTRS